MMSGTTHSIFNTSNQPCLEEKYPGLTSDRICTGTCTCLKKNHCHHVYQWKKCFCSVFPLHLLEITYLLLLCLVRYIKLSYPSYLCSIAIVIFLIFTWNLHSIPGTCTCTLQKCGKELNQDKKNIKKCDFCICLFLPLFKGTYVNQDPKVKINMKRKVFEVEISLLYMDVTQW